jgi:hypothetical protein
MRTRIKAILLGCISFLLCSCRLIIENKNHEETFYKSDIFECFDTFTLETTSTKNRITKTTYKNSYSKAENIPYQYEVKVKHDNALISLTIVMTAEQETYDNNILINNINVGKAYAPQSTNFIYLDDQLIYFDGNTLYQLDENVGISKKLEITTANASYVYERIGAIYLKDDKLHLFSTNTKSTLTEPHNNYYANEMIIDKSWNIIENKEIKSSRGVYALDQPVISSDTYIDGMLKDDLSYFMMNGAVYQYDSDKGIIYTDGYSAMTQPIIADGSFTYAALRREVEGFYYDDEHIFDKTNKDLIIIDLEDTPNFHGQVFNKSGEVYLFINVKGTTKQNKYTNLQKTEVLRLSGKNIQHQFFAGQSFYSGYVYENKKYTFEIAKSEFLSITKGNGTYITFSL